MMSKAYNKLEAIFHRLNMLESTSGLLHWDSATMMPPSSRTASLRGEQLSALAELSHEIISDTELVDLLAEAESSASELTDWQTANLAEMRHQHTHATCLDVGLVSALTKTCAESEHFWREAKDNNDFDGFAPYLDKVLGLVRESADAKADALELSPYDALLDGYDKGTTSAFVDAAFAPLEKELPSLIDAVIEKQSSQGSTGKLNLSASIDSQAKLSRKLMDMLGFDFTTGRQDISIHPFCGGVPDDIRITTRYDENDFVSGMMGVLHETGHALYEHGLPSEWCRQPVGVARGMSMHESQSLFVEMQLGRSESATNFFTKLIKDSLDKQDEQWNISDLYQHINKVERSLIRVNADEVTYPTHVILRYRLEQAMITGDLQVRDLPDAWSDMQYKLLGIRPDCHANGCMQDIHWPDGSFGYFPTYTLGAMIAAQLFDAANKALGNIDDLLEQGNFTPIISWLSDNVHSFASRYSTQDILQSATGKPLDANIFIHHLKQRYLT